ncbi:MAG: penicillin acylase family protein, partial [Gammaproteobacteria bacterium]
RNAMLHWGAPTENQVYADDKGNIGWVPGGLAPIRPNWDGLLPVPGDGRYEWNGFWRGDQLPSAYNPPAGYFSTSNQYNLPEGYPVAERKLGFEWTNASRHERIEEVLRNLPSITLEASQQLQNDIVSLPARRLLTLLRPLSSDDPDTRAALALLGGWDTSLGAASAPAALQQVWFSRHLGKAFKAAVLTPQAAEAMGAPDTAVMLDALERPQALFGDQPERKRDQVLLASLGEAWAEMVKLQGPDARRWQWGKLQYNLNEHPFAAIVDPAMRARLNVGPFPKGGGPYTPNQSTYRVSDFRQTNGPSFRVVVDVGNWDNSRAVNHPGQSGDPASPHYRDLAPLWLTGEYFPLLYSRKAVEAATQARIRLLPAHR